MEKTSLVLYGKEYEAVQKFDYFICGVAGALFAYIGQTYTPHKLDSWYYYLVPSALLCLTICFVCGLRRLQLANYVTQTNRKAHFASEQVAYYYDILVEHRKDPERKTYNRHTSKEWTVAELEQLLTNHQLEQKEMDARWKQTEKRANRIGLVRIFFLIVGFILILSSKVLQPYYNH